MNIYFGITLGVAIGIGCMLPSLMRLIRQNKYHQQLAEEYRLRLHQATDKLILSKNRPKP